MIMKFKSLLILSLFLLLLPAVSLAQVADGYYRVVNLGLKLKGGENSDMDPIKGDFYTYVTDGTIQVNSGNTTQQTFEALQLWEGLDNALFNPQSVVYIKKKGSYVDLEAQGTSVSAITKYNLTLSQTNVKNTVRLSTVVSGMTIFLKTSYRQNFEHFKAETVSSPSANDYYTYWTLVPVLTGSENYVGVKPRLTAGGKHYAPYYASYPFKLASSGMKAYYVKNVTDKTYELQEFASDAVIPGGTPVLIECSSTNVADNKLELLYGNYTSVADNKLKGVYFYNQYVSSPTATTAFNASTMRVWAVKNDKLVLVNTPEGLPQTSLGVPCIPANESYLPVAGTVAATLTDVTDVPPVPKHTITFDTDGGTAISPITAEEGSNITAPTDPTKTGYTFNGWEPKFPETMPTSDLAVKAQWTPNKYKVQFIVDGETVKEESLDYGSTITPAADPTKTGYTFTGWDNTTTVVPANDVTFTAQWKINQYKVKFVVDGATVKEETLDYGSAITAPENNPSKTGYTFTGWDNTATVVPANDVTFTAQWKINSHTVKFISEGETYKEETLDYGQTIVPPAQNPTKTGADFLGWSPDPTTITTMPDNDVEFTAMFSTNDYTITFDTDGGSAIDPITAKYGTAVTAPTSPTKIGYTFKGWEPALPSTIPAGNLTVKAQWTVNKYTIFFTGIATDDCASEQFDYNATVSVEARPTRPNYDFVGWKDLPTSMPAHDVTVEAQWQLKKETVELALKAGWNWVALSVKNDNQTNLNEALTSGNWTSDDLVKTADRYASYSSKYKQWVGNFTREDALSPISMFKVYTKNDKKLVISGTAIDPELTDIVVNPYWNYIGYFNGGAPEISVAEALAGYDAKADDIIKSPTQSALFDGTKWTGSLETLRRGEGYMLYRSATAEPATFKFPVTASPVPGSAKAASPVLYSGNMNIIAAVDGMDVSEGDEVIAMAGGEIRGIASVDAEGKALLTIQGEASDDINFLLQRNGETLAAAKSEIAFAEDAIIGSVGNPTAITFVPQEADNAVLGDVQAIYTAAGALLPTTDLNSLPRGAYIVSSLVDGKTVVTKVTK